MNFSGFKSKKGFTLAEMIVVMFIFSLLSVVIAGIFVQFFNTENRSFISQKLSSDMRFTLEMIAREVRMGNIDYRVTGYYGGTVPKPTDTLAILDANGDQILFGLAGADCQTTSDCYVFVRRGGVDYRVTPDDLAVNQLIFYVSPIVDPFTLQADGHYLAEDQPRVLVVLEEKDAKTGEINLKMQTAVSSKIYQR
ncbi:MAG TPA: type II secretion system protein [bacterium]|nr:type II secretion system protein [bacterium]